LSKIEEICAAEGIEVEKEAIEALPEWQWVECGMHKAFWIK
jgi:hypothetical protein